MHASRLRQSIPATKHKLSPVLDHSAVHHEVINVIVVSQGACLQQSTGVSISGWDVQSPGGLIVVEHDIVVWMCTKESPMHAHTHTHTHTLSQLDTMGRSGQVRKMTATSRTYPSLFCSKSGEQWFAKSTPSGLSLFLGVFGRV